MPSFTIIASIAAICVSVAVFVGRAAREQARPPLADYDAYGDSFPVIFPVHFSTITDGAQQSVEQ